MEAQSIASLVWIPTEQRVNGDVSGEGGAKLAAAADRGTTHYWPGSVIRHGSSKAFNRSSERIFFALAMSRTVLPVR
jgi:hypothetical protein